MVGDQAAEVLEIMQGVWKSDRMWTPEFSDGILDRLRSVKASVEQCRLKLTAMRLDEGVSIFHETAKVMQALRALTAPIVVDEQRQEIDGWKNDLRQRDGEATADWLRRRKAAWYSVREDARSMVVCQENQAIGEAMHAELVRCDRYPGDPDWGEMLNEDIISSWMLSEAERLQKLHPSFWNAGGEDRYLRRVFFEFRAECINDEQISDWIERHFGRRVAAPSQGDDGSAELVGLLDGAGQGESA